MERDIIYIDTDDDITSIIGKIKASKDKIIALVPPKRIGILQSAVNLRLLARTAKSSSKNLVIVANNKALSALAAAAKIPVAKNLQSKPELGEVLAAEADEGEDIIEGAKLPVGELVKTVDSTQQTKVDTDEVEDDLGTLNIDNEDSLLVPSAPKPGEITEPKPKKDKLKVPDFPTFRKKLFLGIGGGILAIIFLIWAIWFAPAATVIITAKTIPAPVSMTLKLGDTTDPKTGQIATVTKTIKKDTSIEFTATGTAMVGTKATGTITITNHWGDKSVSVPSGTSFTSSGLNFITTSAVTVSPYPGKANVSVEAEDVGSDYNLAATDYDTTIIGITATGGQMSGGDSHKAIVVTQEDLQKASQSLVDMPNADIKSQLASQFKNDETIITDSFSADRSTYTSVPAIGAEAADGKAKLTSPTTFTLVGIAKSEMETFLKDAITKQMDNSKNQRVYSDGFDKVSLSGFVKGDGGSTVNVSTTGQIGPNIDQTAIKNLVKGKNFGDTQSIVGGIEGVNNVDVKFSYFWVTSVPNDINKIGIKFQIQNA